MKFRRQLVEGVVRVLLGGAVCATVGCGSSSDGGSAGGGGGGSAGTGGGSTDTVPPKFAGLISADVNMDSGAVSLAWDPASDNDSMPPSIAYAIYVGSKAGEEDFSTPYAFTPAGASGATVSSVVPGQNYFWVVRAVDQAGNQDDNAVELVASPADTTAPRFAGATVATVASSRSALVHWKPARDDGSTSAQIKYEVYVSSSSDPKSFDFKHPDASAKPGDTSVLVTTLAPQTNYFIIARAIDAAGNPDANTHIVSVTTPEGDAPTFGGLKQINPLPEGVKLYWLSAQDSATDVANIVYNVYVTTNPTFGAADLEKPAYTTVGGAVTYVVPNLVNQQKYSFLVRAQDTAGNEDGNTTTLSVRALNGKDTTAPSFDAKTVKVVGDSPSALLVSWSAGTDIVTNPADLVYSVYVSTTADPVADDAQPTFVTAPGATSALIGGLPSQATRWVTVRCADQAGNTLSNTLSKSGATAAGNPADLVAPTFSSVPVVAPDPNGLIRLHVSWTAGTDNVSSLAKLRYRVCASQVEADCLGAKFQRHMYATATQTFDTQTTQPIPPFIDLVGLISRVHYFVYVRAEDEAGNLSSGDYGGAATTPTSFTRDVSPIFFDKCNGCHDPSFGVLATVGVEGGYVDTRLPFSVKSMSLIEKGNPRDSLIYRRINPLGLPIGPFGTPAGALAPDPTLPVTNLYRGPQEPQNAQKIFTTPLSPAEDGAIRDWITQGANAN